ncbi:ParB/RepB/Spo0J family partition protein [Dubosiella newyorkensis]|uniref:Chromosome partitioning protein ParB n=1 Tax=Dubosiella newyorkensis TaxID=1862672 RepID=A0A1U7NQ24_9FIRM|nr:ParB/RepB/Spo0J family partition protein [Dubosiella newyorkensis]OLU47734.1 chromosome partitioning protein ParB [Dubosiella newyorkensis]
MANKTARLGKGINSIFGADVSKVLDDIQNGDVETEAQEQLQIRLEEIRPNPYQPRKVFDPMALEELKDSIQQHGVFTPILVKKSIAGYDLIAGERRLRASKLAGLETIPAIVVPFNDQEMMEIALLENIQREDLNVIEEARAYEQLIQKLGYTQEQLAKRVGKSREHITNLLRLLKLPEDVQDYAINKELSMGHIRALLSLKDEMKMRQIAKMAIDQGLSVRKVEQLVKDNGQKKEKTPVEKPEANLFLIEAKKQMEEMFQTSVKISNQTIQIHFENDQDLTRILEILHLIETNE